MRHRTMWRITLAAAVLVLMAVRPLPARGSLTLTLNPPTDTPILSIVLEPLWTRAAADGTSQVYVHRPGTPDYYSGALLFLYGFEPFFLGSGGTFTDAVRIGGDWSGLQVGQWSTGAIPALSAPWSGDPRVIPLPRDAIPGRLVADGQGMLLDQFYSFADILPGQLGGPIVGLQLGVLVRASGFATGALQLVRDGAAVAEVETLVPVSVAAVPEPSTRALVVMAGIIGLGSAWRRRRPWGCSSGRGRCRRRWRGETKRPAGAEVLGGPRSDGAGQGGGQGSTRTSRSSPSCFTIR